VPEFDPVNIEIGKRIFELRDGKRLSRPKLAKQAGISEQFLREIESGRKGQSAITLRKICRALNVTSDYLLFETGSKDDIPDYATQESANLSVADVFALKESVNTIQEMLDKATESLRYSD